MKFGWTSPADPWDENLRHFKVFRTELNYPCLNRSKTHFNARPVVEVVRIIKLPGNVMSFPSAQSVVKYHRETARF